MNLTQMQPGDFDELGREYALLVLAAEKRIDPWGEPAEGNSKREKEIEDIFAEAKLFYLQDFVECVFEEAEENGVIKRKTIEACRECGRRTELQDGLCFDCWRYQEGVVIDYRSQDKRYIDELAG